MIDPALRRDFSVIIPALNESENVPELFGELEAAFSKHDLDGEVIFVDDGSTDGTEEVARREGKRLRRFKFQRHNRNLGKTEALLTGAREAESDWLVLFDADLQHSPEEIARFLRDEAGNPTIKTHDSGGYFDLLPVDMGEEARRQIVNGLEHRHERHSLRS